jgi:hypothetical protein
MPRGALKKAQIPRFGSLAVALSRARIRLAFYGKIDKLFLGN